MTYNMYCVRDIVADDAFVTFMAPTDGMAVRENLPALSRMKPVKDMELYRIGTFDSTTMEIKPEPKTAVSWDAYKFPEKQTETKATMTKKEDK